MTVYVVLHQYKDQSDILGVYYLKESADAHSAKVYGSHTVPWVVRTQPDYDCIAPHWCGGGDLCVHCQMPREAAK